MASRTRKSLLAFCAGISAIMMAGCTFQVLFPVAMQTSSQDFEIDGSKIKIRVTFTRAVDMSSLVAGTNVILVTEQDANADINITSGSTAADIVITSVADNGDLLIFDPDGFFTLRLVGSGASPIQSSDGEALDGDYETTFVLIG